MCAWLSYPVSSHPPRKHVCWQYFSCVCNMFLSLCLFCHCGERFWWLEVSDYSHVTSFDWSVLPVENENLWGWPGRTDTHSHSAVPLTEMQKVATNVSKFVLFPLRSAIFWIVQHIKFDSIVIWRLMQDKLCHPAASPDLRKVQLFIIKIYMYVYMNRYQLKVLLGKWCTFLGQKICSCYIGFTPFLGLSTDLGDINGFDYNGGTTTGNGVIRWCIIHSVHMNRKLNHGSSVEIKQLFLKSNLTKRDCSTLSKIKSLLIWKYHDDLFQLKYFTGYSQFTQYSYENTGYFGPFLKVRKVRFHRWYFSAMCLRFVWFHK